jgi:anti-anti-sigma factor
MELNVKKEMHGSKMTLKLKGVLDISTSNSIDPYLEDIKDIEVLIFDFNELEFIDSTGIGSIMNAIFLSQEKNFSVVLQGVDDMTKEILEIVGIYQILDTLHKGDA